MLVRPTGVIVDQCDAHGVWFDARELDVICAEVAQRKGVKLPARAAAVAGGAAVATAAAGVAAALAVAEATDSGPGGRQTPLLDIALEMPETVFYGAEAVGGAVSDAVEATDVGEVATGVFEGGADLASEAAEAGSGVLEVVVELLGALFD